jgi:hypothetical protein
MKRKLRAAPSGKERVLAMGKRVEDYIVTNVSPQLFVKSNRQPPSEKRFVPPENSPCSTKPFGGLWTSSYDEQWGSDWVQWCLSENFKSNPFDSWLLIPKSSARVYVIDSLAALQTLLDYRGVEWKLSSAAFSEIGPDFKTLAEEIDGIQLTQEGQWETRFSRPGLYGWDCESTLWLRWAFESVQYLGGKTWPLRGEERRG